MQVIVVRFTAEEIATLDAFAAREHLSRSVAIRRAFAGSRHDGPPQLSKHGGYSKNAIRAADLASRIETVKGQVRPHSELQLGFDTPARLLETVIFVWKKRGDSHPRDARPPTVWCRLP